MPVVSQSITRPIVPVGAITDTCALRKPCFSPSASASSHAWRAIFSIARGATVTAVEGDPYAARDLEVNQSTLRPGIAVAHQSVEKYLGQRPAAADVVVLAVPGGAETRHLIGAEALQQMRPEAFLVNISRGDVVDEAALVAALQEGRIAGAGLAIEVDAPDELVGDGAERYLHRVLQNLVTNALRYARSRILVRVSADDASLVVTVELMASPTW